MSYKIYNTQNWSYERIARYSKELTNAMKQLEDKFSGEIAMGHIALDLATGRQLLWLILDESDNFCAFVTTELQKNLKGENKLTLCHLAGKGGDDLVDMLPVIEAYAKENDVKAIYPIGRIGWHKKLQAYGYKPVIFKYRKEL